MQSLQDKMLLQINMLKYRAGQQLDFVGKRLLNISKKAWSYFR